MSAAADLHALDPAHAKAAMEVAVEAACARARGDYHAFVELTMLSQSGYPLRQGAIHRVWDLHLRSCWAAGLHPAIYAPFGHGKCQVGSDTIQHPDGSRSRIGDRVDSAFDVLAFDESDFSYRPARARCFENGVRPVRRIRLWSGRTLCVTEHHPLLTVGGWAEAGTLVPGDFVAVARQLPEMGVRRLREGEAALLGYLVGDGTTVYTVAVTSGSGELREAVAAIGARLGFSVRCAEKGAREAGVHLGAGARAWAREHGLFGCDSRAKRTPPAVFTAPNDQVAEYLGAYFSCDGTVAATRGGAVELYSVNRALLDDVQSLLLRFGVLSRVRRKNGRYRGRVHRSWRLVITGAEALARFRASVPMVGAKGRKLDALALAKAHPGLNFDLVPNAFRDLLIETPHWHKEHSGVSLDQQSRRGTTRDVVRRAAFAEGNPALARVSSDAVAWDLVVDVEDAGEQMTYGVEVDRHHTYLSADVVSHNTVQLIVARAAFELGRDVNMRCKVVSDTDKNARNRVMEISRLLRTPKYRLVYPHVRASSERSRQGVRRKGDPEYVRRQWTQHEILLERPGEAIDPSVQAFGIMGAGIGGRGDLILFDDVVNQKNAVDEPKYREKIVEDFDMVWMSRREPWGRVGLIGTLWHQQDLHHELMRRPAWCVLVQRISLDKTHIEQEVYNPPANYPLPTVHEGEDRRPVRRVVSSTIDRVRFDPARAELEVGFHSGGVYVYSGVPRAVYDGMCQAPSKGRFFVDHVKGRFEFKKVANGEARLER